MIKEFTLRPTNSLTLMRSIWNVVKQPQDFLGYRIEVRLKGDETGGYVGYVAQLPGVVSEGDNAQAAMANVIEAFQACLTTYKAERMPIPWITPEPKQEDEEAFVVVRK